MDHNGDFQGVLWEDVKDGSGAFSVFVRSCSLDRMDADLGFCFFVEPVVVDLDSPLSSGASGRKWGSPSQKSASHPIG